MGMKKIIGNWTEQPNIEKRPHLQKYNTEWETTCEIYYQDIFKKREDHKKSLRQMISLKQQFQI